MNSRLQVIRKETNPDLYITGALVLDGNELCKTLEPGYERLPHPAIPAGVYPLTLQTSGEVYGWMTRSLSGHAFSDDQKKTAKDFADNGVPLLQNIPGRDDVEIHIGNSEKDTLGCTLLGDADNGDGTLSNSTDAYYKAYPKLLDYIQNDPDHTIEYVDIVETQNT